MLDELDKIHASEELIQETLDYCKANSKTAKEHKGAPAKKITRKINRWVTAAVACGSIVLLSSGAAYAYNAVTGDSLIKKIYQITNTASSLNYADGITDNNGNSYTYDGMTDVKDVKSDKNITVTMDSYVVDGNKADVIFTVKTNDGSSLNETTEDKVAVIARDRFNKITVTVDGKTINTSNSVKADEDYCMQQRVDDASDAAKATIKLSLSVPSKKTLDGSTISFKLGDYTSYYDIMESIGFKYASVADMFKGVTLAGEDEFTGDNSMYGYADSDVVLAPGKMHIEFSDKYAGSYIDNAGYTVKDSTSKSKSFVMTIVPANDTVAAELEKVNVQSVTTGRPTAIRVKKLGDGRIQVTYAADFDRAFSQTKKGVHTDTDNTHLSSLVMKRVLETNKKEVLSSNECDVAFDCSVSSTDTAIAYDSNITVNDSYYKGTSINIKSVKISTTELALTGSITLGGDDSRFSGSGSYSPLITMKNGTTFNAGNKMSGGFNHNTGKWDALWILPTYIDTGDIASITWHGTLIYQAE